MEHIANFGFFFELQEKREEVHELLVVDYSFKLDLALIKIIEGSLLDVVDEVCERNFFYNGDSCIDFEGEHISVVANNLVIILIHTLNLISFLNNEEVTNTWLVFTRQLQLQTKAKYIMRSSLAIVAVSDS